jgi:hypothetical protein
MRKNYSNWREDLREVVDIESSEPETEAKSEVKIGDKKVNNKIVINPTMKEAFGEIGALVLEVTEIGEEHCDDKEKKKRDIENLQNDKDTKEGRKPGKLKEAAIPDVDAKIAMLRLKRARLEKKASKSTPQSPAGEEVQERTLTPGEKEEKEDIVKGMKKGGFKKRYGEDAKSVMYATATKLAKEETEDGLRDKRQMYGGVDGSNRYNKPVSNTPNTFGKKKPAGGPSALKRVKASITDKYGKGAIIDTKKK